MLLKLNLQLFASKKFHAGTNAKLGKDYTLFALTDGYVKFEKFGSGKKRVSIYPERVEA